MQIRLEPPPVYFMHVPKTAGTALGSWLRAGYRAQDYIDLDIPQVLACPPERLSRIRCYHSWHHGRGMYDWLGRPDLPVVTVLRDPIERTVSHFEQHRRHLERHPELFHESYLASMAGLLGGASRRATTSRAWHRRRPGSSATAGTTAPSSRRRVHRAPRPLSGALSESARSPGPPVIARLSKPGARGCARCRWSGLRRDSGSRSC